MRHLFHALAAGLAFSGCASVAVQAPVPAPNPVPALVAGRPVVLQEGCPERFQVAPGMMGNFAEEFPGQKVEDSAFQAFVREAYSLRIASGTRGGRITLQRDSCDPKARLAGVGFSGEGTRLSLDTARIDTGAVYVARSPIVYVLADSATRVGFFGKIVPETVKLVDVEMSYGLYDPRTRKMIASGVVRGQSSTGAVSEPDVIRDDWYSASKWLAAALVDRIDSILVPDSVSRR